MNRYLISSAFLNGGASGANQWAEPCKVDIARVMTSGTRWDDKMLCTTNPERASEDGILRSSESNMCADFFFFFFFIFAYLFIYLFIWFLDVDSIEILTA